MRKLWRSLSFRLALAYAGVLCLSMAVLSGVYYWIAVVRPLDGIRSQVDRESRVLSQLYIVDGEQALVSALENRVRRSGPRRAFHAFMAADGTVRTSNLPSWPAKSRRGWFSIEADVYRDGDEQDYSALVQDRMFRNGARLIVGRDAEDVEEVDEVMLIALPWVTGLTLAFSILALAFSILGGLAMSRAIGRRLDTISFAARQVMAGDLGGRVAVAGKGDDFDRLAQTLNLMLDRNQELFEAVRRVSDNVAHELRTPLARLLARLETLELQCDGSGRQKADVEAALGEARRLQAIFNALLRIARIEGGRHESSFRKVDMSVLAMDACELYAPMAQAKGIKLHHDSSADVEAVADPDLIFQSLTNLLDNALKHTGPGGAITLEVRGAPDDVVISVRDTGTGLQPGEAGHVTERFFRGQDARGLPGEGLGLSLVSAIAALHHGHLHFRDNEPGLSVELILPKKPLSSGAA